MPAMKSSDIVVRVAEQQRERRRSAVERIVEVTPRRLMMKNGPLFGRGGFVRRLENALKQDSLGESLSFDVEALAELLEAVRRAGFEAGYDECWREEHL